MKPFFEEGKIRISPASFYKDGVAKDPKTDDELNKRQWSVGDNASIKTHSGIVFPIIGDIKKTFSTFENYYTLCLSCDFEPTIFEEFGYNSCIIIKDPEQFAYRLEQHTKDLLPNWCFHHNPIEYFDPNRPLQYQRINATMYKDFSYAYQMEYRFIWDPLGNGGGTIDYIDLEIGSLEDICELYTL